MVGSSDDLMKFQIGVEKSTWLAHKSERTVRNLASNEQPIIHHSSEESLLLPSF